jgi:hypothetical protein
MDIKMSAPIESDYTEIIDCSAIVYHANKVSVIKPVVDGRFITIPFPYDNSTLKGVTLISSSGEVIVDIKTGVKDERQRLQ